MELSKKLAEIKPLNQDAMARAKQKWDHLAKPLESLGLLEKYIIKIAGMTGDHQVRLDQKALTIFCSDNGVVAQGVTQTDSQVTAAVTANFAAGLSCATLMAERAGCHVFPVDIGVAVPLAAYGEFSADEQNPVLVSDSKAVYPILNRKLMAGTNDFTQVPAMTRETALEAVWVGIELAGELKKRGYQVIATGEMGIGNTTTSSAAAAVLLPAQPAAVTGRGAGLSRQGLANKIRAIETGINKWKPNPEDAIDVLAKVGGLDLAGLAGVFLGGGIYQIPVIADGFISCVSALLAVKICPLAGDYMLGSHLSAEPAAAMVMSALGLLAPLQAQLAVGEGTGALSCLPMLDMALDIYHKMETFEQINIQPYTPWEE